MKLDKELNVYEITPQSNLKDRIEVEIGDSKEPDVLLPQAKIQRWGNESNVSIRLKDFTEYSVVQESDKVIFGDEKKEVHFYQLEDDEGANEIEVILNEKPESNIVEFTLVDKDVEYLYQPPLTKKEIKAGAIRPENVIGSYAVYAKTPKVNVTGGKEYKCGKVGHIFRPKIVDSVGNEVWGELHIKNSILSVTIPQEFLDKAVYPVRHAAGLTFGYGSQGASSAMICDNSGDYKAAMRGDVSGSVSAISAYIKYETGVSNRIFHLSNNSSSSKPETPVYTSSSAAIASTSYTWNSVTGLSVSLTDPCWVDVGAAQGGYQYYAYIAYDTGGVSGYGSFFTFSWSNNSNKYSIYATYTVVWDITKAWDTGDINTRTTSACAVINDAGVPKILAPVQHGVRCLDRDGGTLWTYSSITNGYDVRHIAVGNLNGTGYEDCCVVCSGYYNTSTDGKVAILDKGGNALKLLKTSDFSGSTAPSLTRYAAIDGTDIYISTDRSFHKFVKSGSTWVESWYKEIGSCFQISVADLGNGKRVYVDVASVGLKCYQTDGTLDWTQGGTNVYQCVFAIGKTDSTKTGKQIVLPYQSGGMVIDKDGNNVGSFTPSNVGGGIICYDCDGDGEDEFYFTDMARDVYCYERTGVNTYTQKYSLLDAINSSNYAALAHFDINNDGSDEIFIFTTDGHCLIYDKTLSTKLKDLNINHGSAGGFWKENYQCLQNGIVFADTSGDGHADLVISGGTGYVDVFECGGFSGGTNTSDTRDLRITGTGTAVGETRDLRITGATMTASDTRTLRTSGQNSSDNSREVRMTGHDNAVSAIAVRIAGKDLISDARDVKILGQNATNDSRDIRVSGRDNSASSRDLKVSGQDSTNTAKDIRLSAQDSISATKELFISGIANAPDDRGLRLIGTLATNDSRTIKIEGVGAVFNTADERSISTRGQNSILEDRVIKIAGSDVSSSNKEIKIHGQDFNNDARGVRISGIDTSSDNREIKISGTDTSSANRAVGLQGSDNKSSTKEIYVTGQSSESDNRDIKINGVIEVSDERSLFITSSGIGKDSERGLNITGQICITYDPSLIILTNGEKAIQIEGIVYKKT